jgi:hypothetical protein
MRHRPPLTAAELAEIYDREPTPTVLRLLREIHRLHAAIRRADQIRRMIGTGGASVPSVVWLAFENELKAEPCLTDPPTPRQAGQIERTRKRLLQNDGPKGDR